MWRIPLALHCCSQEKQQVAAPCAQRLLAEDNLKTVSLLEDAADASENHPDF